ncbi:MAG: sigma-70 family RNA polymerase sigma factor [Armatimonadota bacterium]
MKIFGVAKSSDQACFEALLRDHRRIILKVVSGFAWQPDDQQDLAQEIRVQLWRAFPKYDSKRTFSTWMYQVALNTAISWSRQAKLHKLRFAEVELLNEIPANPQPEDDDSHLLYKLIEVLDELSRALLLLTIDDRSHIEIGEILGISPGNVATKISRLKAKLRLEVASTNLTEK